MGPILKCDLLSPFITSWKKKKMITWKKNRTLLKIKEKQKPNECFILPYGLLCKNISTCANDANRIQPRLRNGKKTKQLSYACATVPRCTLPPSSSHGCLALICKSKVAWGLSISRILSKWPPIGVMQQSHTMKWWDLSFRFVSFHFPYSVILTGNRGHVPYTLHTAHTCEYGLTS